MGNCQLFFHAPNSACPSQQNCSTIVLAVQIKCYPEAFKVNGIFLIVEQAGMEIIMMGFGFLMMLLVFGVPLVGIVVLIVWLVNRSKK